MADSQSLQVSGKLTAVGTSSQPIVFTTTRTTATAGVWRDIEFLATSDPTSTLSYATIDSAGATFGRAIYVYSCSPNINHVTIATCSTIGVIVDGATARPLISFATITGLPTGVALSNGASPTLTFVTFASSTSAAISIGNGSYTPTIRNCTFTQNASAIINASSSTVDARLCNWSSADGPSGAGPGHGQSVPSTVLYEPWLTAVPNDAYYYNSALPKNRAFAPLLPVSTFVQIDASANGSGTMTITDNLNNVIRTVSGSLSGSFEWDGRDSAGSVVPNATYGYEIDSSSATSDVAAPIRGYAVVDSSRALTFSGITLTSPVFSPNADGIKDTDVVSGSTNYDTASWTILIADSNGATVRTVNLQAAVIGHAWDGRNDSGILLPDADYQVQVTAAVGQSSSAGALAVTIDTTYPIVAISAPTTGTSLSNISRGSDNLQITGTATDMHFTTWTLEYGSGSSPTTWTQLATSANPASDSELFNWATLTVANGTYTLRLRASDSGGNSASATSTVVLSNFNFTQAIYQVSGATGGTIPYTSTIPVAGSETVSLRNAAGQTVRTLFNGTRAAGTFVDSWNGRDDAGALLPDGPYFAVASVTAAGATLSWDQTNVYRSGTDIEYYPSLSATFDPLNNTPLAVTYTFNQPCRVYVVFSVNTETQPCGSTDYCFENQVYEPSGRKTVYWSGVDDAGVLRTDLNHATTACFVTTFPKNAVILYGSKPTVGPVSVTAPYYGPAFGTQTVGFDLTTYQSQVATIQVTFKNQSTGSILRTVTQQGQAAGHVTITWDGRADNGMWVAPGVYIVTVSATDAIGNTATGQILTNIWY
ncbi:MAG TPA: FlgD immunoglobulin-like domain containing protein [Thermoanaerobaculia bacterium]|jgi:flagellar hook assembly protein FlgD